MTYFLIKQFIYKVNTTKRKKEKERERQRKREKEYIT